MSKEVGVTPIEDKIQVIIGNTWVSGISGGVDTLDKDVDPSSSIKSCERSYGTLIVTEANDEEDLADPTPNGNTLKLTLYIVTCRHAHKMSYQYI